MKPKKNYTPGPNDNCMTPPYAIPFELRYWLSVLQDRYSNSYLDFRIWESACGHGDLAIALQQSNISFNNIYASDIKPIETFVDLHQLNFFEDIIPDHRIQLTNPPYSLKTKWIIRSYELGTPFALLVPVEILGVGKLQPYLFKYGFEMMLLDSRVDFRMPNINNWLDSSSQFPVMWLCHNVLPQQVMVGSIKAEKKAFLEAEKTRMGYGPELSVSKVQKMLRDERKRKENELKELESKSKAA